MSQRKEKYVRRIERRVESLEQQMWNVVVKLTSQGIEFSRLEDDLAVYQAAMNARDWKRAEADAAAARKARAERRELEKRRARYIAGIILCTLLTVLMIIVSVKAYALAESEWAALTPTSGQVIKAYDLTALISKEKESEEWTEDPQEAEKIETALLEQGYFSLAVPMPFVYQDYMRTYCAVYGCPYPLALAVAQIESGFDMDAVGANGEVGIMQLNPGPSGAYHAELQAVTGMDPTTPAGNIADGCYLLGKYLAEYGDATKAAMAYNMGEAGARKAWAAGVTSTEYSRAVIAAMEDWECTVNPWNGV